VNGDVNRLFRDIHADESLVHDGSLRSRCNLGPHAGLLSGESPLSRPRERPRAGRVKMATVEQTDPHLDCPPAVSINKADASCNPRLLPPHGRSWVRGSSPRLRARWDPVSEGVH
jgi:hypothetical protein